MDPENYTSLKGHFLMAMPSLTDPNFKRSVTCISELLVCTYYLPYMI